MENTSLSAIQSYSQINIDFDRTLKESDLHKIARDHRGLLYVLR